MEKVALYPYNQDSLSVISYIEDIKNYEVKSLLTFREHETYLRKRADITKFPITISTNFVKCMGDVDCVIFCDNINQAPLESYIEKINIAKKMGKRVLVDQNLFTSLHELDIYTDVEINDNEIMTGVSGIFNKNLLKDSILEISIPVITIYGFYQNCSKFDIQLQLYSYLKKKNIKAGFISSNSMGDIFGMNLMPLFMFEKDISLDNKILRFNKYVFDLVKKNNLDLLVIGVPGGIATYNNTSTNRFGELGLVVGNAVSADIGIMCLGYTRYVDDQYFEYLQNIARFKLNSYIDMFCISNIKTQENSTTHILENYFLDNRYLENSNTAFDTSYEVKRINDKNGIINSFDNLIISLINNINSI